MKLLGALLTGLVAFSSCVIPLNPSQKAHFVVSIAAPRYLAPEAVAFELEGRGPEGAQVTVALADGPNQVTDLTPGDWDLTVVGRAEDDTVVQEGATTANLIPGDNGSIAITLGVPVNLTVNVASEYPLTVSVEQDSVVLTPNSNFYQIAEPLVPTVRVISTTGFDSYRWFIDGVLQDSTTDTWLAGGSGASTLPTNVIHHVLVIAQKQEIVESFEIFVVTQPEPKV